MARVHTNSTYWPESGEDDIVFSNGSEYAANIEKAEAVPAETSRAPASEELRLVDTPDAKTIVQLVEGYNLPIEKPSRP